MRERLNRYNTYTTSVELFDYMKIGKRELKTIESGFHRILKNNGWQIGKTEWYVVSEEIFKLLKNNGFAGFKQLII